MPPVDRMFLITAWLVSILYGINLVIFGVCMYILWNRKQKAHWIIPASCIIYISIATAQNIIYLLRALQAFTNRTITSIPDGSILYLLRVTTALSMTNWGLYILTVLGVNLLLIWRLYVVWQLVWILIVMLILEAAHVATAIATWALALQSDQVFSRIIRNLGYACFAFNLVVTIGVTSGIAYRLWRAGRVVSGFTGHNAYKTAMYTVIESGALYTASYVVQTILFISRSLAGTMAIDVGLQIATMVPLLLIARLGFSLKDQEATRAESSTFAEPIQVNVTEERCIFPVGSGSGSTSKSIQSYTKSSEKSTGVGVEEI